jgi:hypothetical protein
MDKTILELLESKEARAVLLALKEAKKPHVNSEIARIIIEKQFLLGKKRAIESRVARTIHLLKDLNLIRVRKLGSSPVYELSKTFKNNMLNYMHQFSDSYKLSGYPPNLIFSLPSITLYGIPEKMYSPSSNSRTFFKLKKLIENLKLEIKQLESIKKEYRLPFLSNAFEEELAKQKKKTFFKFSSHYREVLINLLNYTDWSEEHLKESIRMLFNGGFRTITDKDVPFLRKGLRNKDKHLTVSQIKKKFPQIQKVYGYDLVSYPYFFNDFSKFTDNQKEDLIKFFSKVLQKVNYLYPTRVTIVGNSWEGLVVNQEFL